MNSCPCSFSSALPQQNGFHFIHWNLKIQKVFYKGQDASQSGDGHRDAPGLIPVPSQAQGQPRKGLRHHSGMCNPTQYCQYQRGTMFSPSPDDPDMSSSPPADAGRMERHKVLCVYWKYKCMVNHPPVGITHL